MISIFFTADVWNAAVNPMPFAIEQVEKQACLSFIDYISEPTIFYDGDDIIQIDVCVLFDIDQRSAMRYKLIHGVEPIVTELALGVIGVEYDNLTFTSMVWDVIGDITK